MKFWFHYNKPASKTLGKQMVSVHCDKRCYIVEGNKLLIGVPTFGKINKRQPYFVMMGEANHFAEVGDKITIT